jgi:hypothetical protein
MNNQTTEIRPPLRAISWKDWEKIAQRATEEAKVKAEQEAREATINDGLRMYKDVISGTPDGRVPRNTMIDIIKKLGSPPWMSCYHIYNVYRNCITQQRKASKKENVPVSVIVHPRNFSSSSDSAVTAAEGLLSLSLGDSSQQPGTEDIQRKKGGRPVGSTAVRYVADKNKIEESKGVAASKLKENCKEKMPTTP